MICSDGEAFAGGSGSSVETLPLDEVYLDGMNLSVDVLLNDVVLFRLLVLLFQSEWTTFNFVGEVNDSVETWPLLWLFGEPLLKLDVIF